MGKTTLAFFKMVRKRRYGDRESGINFPDFQPSKIKPILMVTKF